MKLVISDQKSGKSYSKAVDNAENIFGKKIGEQIELSEFGLSGYSGKITGGSDLSGFPMRFDLSGTGRKKILITENKKEGLKKRVTRRANTVSAETAQLNVIVTKFGDKKLDELIAPAKKDDKEASVKEQMIKQSLEVAGTAKAAEAMSAEEFKKGERKR